MSKKPQKPRDAFGMWCGAPGGLEQRYVGAYPAKAGLFRAPEARRRAAWLTRAAEWMEAKNV